eukprot:TRINITY_DN2185_c0_g1_i1.p1 TRINITY_DN2185_c0_g1~~TRINITY_DN2185_c0_g1_i1.p1  ORF type:complete len:227 (-),score=90.62 TRINITY_DN2185_c0_g1_i1:96-776(-)
MGNLCGSASTQEDLKEKIDATLQSSSEITSRESLLDEVFTWCDDDKSGFLSLDEYMQLSDMKDDAQTKAIFKAVFDMADAGNKDGKLSRDEFVKYNLENAKGLDDKSFKQQVGMWLSYAKKYDVKSRESLLDEVFTWCDDDKSGFLSLDEYMQLSDMKDDAQTKAIFKAVFDMADAGNKDGKLSRDEFVKYNLENAKGLDDKSFKQQVGMWLSYGKKYDVNMQLKK